MICGGAEPATGRDGRKESLAGRPPGSRWAERECVPSELPVAVGEQVRVLVVRFDGEPVQGGRGIHRRSPVDDLQRREVDRHDPRRDRLGEGEIRRAVLPHLGDEEMELAVAAHVARQRPEPVAFALRHVGEEVLAR